MRDFTNLPAGPGFPIEEVERSIPERFERIVLLNGGWLAVRAKEGTVTYAELNRMANRVARAILAKGLPGPEPVGILLEKGVQQMAAMVGVLKAGKFFVLIDPSFPYSRIDATLEDCSARLMISSDRQMEAARQQLRHMPASISIESIAVESVADDLRLAIEPDQYAYLVYTSGSTGRPKAVIQTHRNLQHRIFLHTRENGVSRHDRMALLPAGTSNAITNSFNALLTGATLCPFDVRKEGVRRLANWLVNEKISVCQISSTLFRSLCQNLDDAQSFPDLRFVRLRSEPAYKSDVELFRKYFSPSCTLVNGLSSSETGPLSDLFIRADTEISGNELPVGYAAEGKTILLVDDEGQELGANEVGEIVVRSRYLSPGYWGRPELTAAKFKTDSRSSNERLYYTGDLGLMLADGCLIHKGRKDFRVKIRGYGVEIIEVENAMRRHEAIRDAVVIGRTDDSAETRLVGYFVAATQPAPTTSGLRQYLSKLLPDYMVPSTFVRLDAFPLMPNGKIDRAALPEPARTRPELDVAYTEPRDDVETKLAQIWTEVLTVNRIGIHDNFFDLGGHSLSATRIVSRVVQTFQLELPIKDLFDAPTVAKMAVVITENRMKQASDAEMVQMLCEVEAMTEEEAQKQITGVGDQNTNSVGHG